MWEIAFHLAVAVDVFDGVFLCCPFFPRDVFDWLWDLIGSVTEGLPTYSVQSESLNLVLIKSKTPINQISR